jgi:hypothetical protein
MLTAARYSLLCVVTLAMIFAAALCDRRQSHADRERYFGLGYGDSRDAMSSTSCLAVVVGMFLRGMFVVFNGMQMMPMRDLGVMRRLFMIARFVMFCRLAMMLRGLLMMVRRLLMVLVDCVLRHCSLPDFFVGLSIEASQGSMKYL